MPVPMKGLAAKMSGLSGPSGSAPGGQCAQQEEARQSDPAEDGRDASRRRSPRPWLPEVEIDPQEAAVARRACASRPATLATRSSRRAGRQRLRRVAREPLVDDEAIAGVRPAGRGIEHRAGERGSAPQRGRRRVRRASRRAPRRWRRPASAARRTIRRCAYTPWEPPLRPPRRRSLTRRPSPAAAGEGRRGLLPSPITMGEGRG